ncbi:MAG: sodium:proton antiporter [Fervidicoccus fontis]|uniref:Sodium:proton antiporter n=1 Tax=Fervidicoccus fontis TaxID=683846 RepID=A0A2J6N3Y6_9CREN|nr:MAG: sodium:proton antiporter [Fervidicoccus fontis]
MEFSTFDIALFFLIVASTIIVAFLGARWRAADMSKISEWSIGGRKFGTLIVWFLMGGDIYTAYALISVPGGAYGQGGFILYSAVYGAMSYPFLYYVAPRLYLIAKKKGMITGGDYVRERFKSDTLSLLISLTGIIAMLPYIALQIVGIKYVLQAMNFPIVESYIIAFLIVAAFTVVAGLRGPALGAIIKDILLWAVIITITVVFAIRFDGFSLVFKSLDAQGLNYMIPPNLMIGYMTLAFGNGIAWLLFPNLLTGILGSKDAKTIKKNSVLLPVYQVWMLILAIFGLVALSENLVPNKVSSLAFPSVLTTYFSPTFVSIAFAAIIIGAMIPASLQALSAANLITRNIYLQYINKQASERKQVLVGRISVFIMIVASLIFVLTPAASGLIFYLLTMSYAWLLQTLPAIILSMYWHSLDKYSVAAGWAVGVTFTTYGLYTVKFASSLLPWFKYAYVGLVGLALNLVVLLAVYAIVRMAKIKYESGIAPEEFTDYDVHA